MKKPLKIGLIGTGNISGMHALAMAQASDRLQLAAVCDVNEEAVRRFAGRTHIDAIYTDAASMLADADLDAVDICASHHVHRDLAIAAAEAGRHVLLEKPMAISLTECRDIIGAADKAGVTLMIGQQLRHVPSYVGVKALVDAGELGTIWGARSDSWVPRMMTRSPAPGSDAATWRRDGARSGGGSMIWQAVHFIDLLRFFLGDATRVFGTCWTDHPMLTGGAEDRAMATIEFECGAIAHISNSWTTRAPWLFQFMLLGDEGSVYTPVVEGNALEQHQAPAFVSSPPHDPGDGTRPFVPVEPPPGLYSDNPYVNEMVHFVDCCQSGEEPVSSGRDNLGTMKILFGIYESSRRREMVSLDEL